MATLNWQSIRRHGVAMAFLWLAMAARAYDALPASLPQKYVAQADRQLAAARKAYKADTNKVENVWRLGRALFFRAEFAVGEEREQLAEKGIAVCEQGLVLAPDSPEMHYYLAMNQGQLARERLFGALGLVRRMRDHLRTAAVAKPLLDRGGPDRCLALLHRDAPGWPISVGDKKEARRHLNKAYLLAPDYPENVLVLIESLIKWGYTDSLEEKLRSGEVALEKARKELTGTEWEVFHDDWADRWSAVKQRAEQQLAE